MTDPLEALINPIIRKQRLTEAPSGLIVVREQLTPEERAERRADNKAMAKSRQLHRKRKKHGRP